MKIVKYSYAFCLGNTISIDEVTSDHRKQNLYTCICCGDKMVAVINGSKKKHFKHLNHVAHDIETYLHVTSKSIFKESYLNALANEKKVIIEYFQDQYCSRFFEWTKVQCHYGNAIIQYDLTKRFRAIHEEVYYGQYKPDILLEDDNGNAIFIEIYVKHKCSDEKVASGNRIIELHITDEKDFEQIKKLHFPIKNGIARYYNFKTEKKISSFCHTDNKGCGHAFDYFLLFNDGTYEIDTNRLEYLMGNMEMKNVTHYILKSHEYGLGNEYQLHQYMLDIARRKGIDVKNCIQCSNHINTHKLFGSNSTRCAILRKHVKYEFAIKCEHYSRL